MHKNISLRAALLSATAMICPALERNHFFEVDTQNDEDASGYVFWQ